MHGGNVSDQPFNGELSGSDSTFQGGRVGALDVVPRRPQIACDLRGWSGQAGFTTKCRPVLSEDGFYLGGLRPRAGRKLILRLLQHQLRKFVAAETAELIGGTDHESKAAACVAHRLQIGPHQRIKLRFQERNVMGAFSRAPTQRR